MRIFSSCIEWRLERFCGPVMLWLEDYFSSIQLTGITTVVVIANRLWTQLDCSETLLDSERFKSWWRNIESMNELTFVLVFLKSLLLHRMLNRWSRIYNIFIHCANIALIWSSLAPEVSPRIKMRNDFKWGQTTSNLETCLDLHVSLAVFRLAQS